MTERLYHHDSYLTEFGARIVERSADGLRIYLDRTAFYPDSGGQPRDAGNIAGAPVVEVIDEGERIAHVIGAPVPGDTVDCRVDWDRRFDHMQQHSGQHLLSAVLVELYSIPTVSFHLGAESSTIDVETGALDAQQIARITTRANQIVFENRPVAVSFEQSSEAVDLRKPSEREGVLRVISILEQCAVGSGQWAEKTPPFSAHCPPPTAHCYDRSACGGTHVRATGEIGPVLLRKLEKIRNTVRIEFLCGLRAVRRAHADYEALAKAGRLLSSQLDEIPERVAEQTAALQAEEKARRKLAIELARYRGRELYASTAADADGVRRVIQKAATGGIDDEVRTAAQSFTAQPKAVFLAIYPQAVLLAVSPDLGINAGDKVRAAVTRAGGRGGGNAQIAQGSLPSSANLDAVVAELGGAG